MTGSTIDPAASRQNLRAVWEHALARLAAAGIANHEQEAAWLLEAVLGPIRLDRHLSPLRPVDDADAEQVRTLLERRAKWEPLQYISGSQEFCGLDLLVGPEALIPRPESELLVQEAAARLRTGPSPVLADIGTGSGCLAIALARAMPEATLFATDCSPAALSLARRNARRHGVEDRVRVLEGNLLGPLEELHLLGQLAAIVSNPPYLATADLDVLQPEIRLYEPRLALDGGADGLRFYRPLLEEAHRFLTADGFVILEVGHGQAHPVRELGARLGYRHIATTQDAGGIDRVVCLQKTGSHGRKDGVARKMEASRWIGLSSRVGPD